MDLYHQLQHFSNVIPTLPYILLQKQICEPPATVFPVYSQLPPRLLYIWIAE